MIKKKRIARCLLMTMIAFMVSEMSVFASEPVITVKKAADVNGTSITMLTLNTEYRQVLKQQGLSEDSVPSDQAEAFKKEILDSLINQELLYQECVKNDIVVDEETVKTTSLKAKESFDNEEAFLNALKDANMQEKDLTNRIRKTIAINQLVEDEISKQVVVTDDEAKDYYDTHPELFKRTEKVRASHILVKVDEEDGEAKIVAAREKIKEYKRRISAGEDFAQLAKENSDCPSSANGGELGYFERGKMVKEFEDAAFSLATGDVSDIVRTDFGYHLIKVTDRVEPGVIAYETVEEELRDFMYRQRVQEGVSTLLDTLKNGSDIEIYL